jgi:cytochrome c oxidase subunit 2
MNRVFPFPEDISTFGGRIDNLFAWVFWICAIVFVAVEVTLIVFAIIYRHREGRVAHYTHGNDRLELSWTIATALIVFILAIVSRPLWLDIKLPSRFPAADVSVIVTAKQFEWNVTYAGADGQLKTADDFTRRGQLHVPVNKKVHVQLAAEDVIHSFFLPNLRLKQDAVPGMEIPAWFEATKPGTYVIACAELCGLGHYRMKGTLTVHEDAAFAQWQQTQIAAQATASTLAVAP